jgi:chromosome segregation ATPase
MMDLSIITDLEAERDRLRAEAEKDYEDMRRFQKAYIEADQECRHLRAEVEALKADLKTVQTERDTSINASVDDTCELIQLRADLAAAVEIITGCIGSLEYVDRNHNNITGYGVREQRIAEANSFLARLEVRT